MREEDEMMFIVALDQETACYTYVVDGDDGMENNEKTKMILAMDKVKNSVGERK